MRQQGSMGGFGGLQFRMSPLTKSVLIALVAMYVFQLLVKNWVGLPIDLWLPWWSLDSGNFKLWQPVTFYLYQGPRPFGAALAWLMIFFFVTPVEQMLGRGELFRFLGFTAILTGIVTFGLDLVGVVGGASAAVGMHTVLTALVVVFCFARPDAQVRLWFVLPIKASWIGWGTGVLGAVFFLLSRDVSSTVMLTGWVSAYLWIELLRRGGTRGARLRYEEWKAKRRLSKFKVIEGEGRGRSRPPDGSIPWGRPADDDDDPIVH